MGNVSWYAHNDLKRKCNRQQREINFLQSQLNSEKNKNSELSKNTEDKDNRIQELRDHHSKVFRNACKMINRRNQEILKLRKEK